MPESLATFAAAQFRVVTAAQSSACGYLPAERERLCARGAWYRARDGIYLPEPAPDPKDDPVGRHEVDIAAALLALSDPTAVVADISGAVLWGFEWITRPSLSTVHLARPNGAARHYPGLRVRRVQLPAEHVREAPNGMPVLSASRLLVDLARRMHLRAVLVMADRAYASGLATPAEVEGVLAYCRRWPGAAAAARHLRHADPRSGSAGESIARAVFIEMGLTDFDLQAEIRYGTAGAYAKVDIIFHRWRLVFEIDGKRKYDQPGSIVKEKIREDGIRDEDYLVVRLLWDELVGNQTVLQQKIRGSFARAAKRLRRAGLA